jgi:hypothetical protein
LPPFQENYPGRAVSIFGKKTSKLLEKRFLNIKKNGHYLFSGKFFSIDLFFLSGEFGFDFF